MIRHLLLYYLRANYKKIVWFIVFVLLLIIAFSCTPIQKLNRLQRLHPYLFEAKTDTILHRDTIKIVVPATKIDTVVHYTSLFDTVIITKNNITTKVWQVKDTVHVATEADTVFIAVPYEAQIPYTKYVTEYAPKTNAIKKWVILLLVAVLAFFVFNFKTEK